MFCNFKALFVSLALELLKIQVIRAIIYPVKQTKINAKEAIMKSTNHFPFQWYYRNG